MTPVSVLEPLPLKDHPNDDPNARCVNVPLNVPQGARWESGSTSLSEYEVIRRWDNYIAIVIAIGIAIMHIRSPLEPEEPSLLRTPALF